MDAQAGANTPGWLHHPATRLEQASTDVLEKKMTVGNPTAEQIAAVEWLRLVSTRGKLIVSDSSVDAYADVILAALPAEWTEWQPALPTKPGHYADRDDFVWTLSADGEWSGDPNHIGQFLPLTRLVPAVEFVDVNA